VGSHLGRHSRLIVTPCSFIAAQTSSSSILLLDTPVLVAPEFFGLSGFDDILPQPQITAPSPLPTASYCSDRLQLRLPRQNRQPPTTRPLSPQHPRRPLRGLNPPAFSNHRYVPDLCRAQLGKITASCLLLNLQCNCSLPELISCLVPSTEP
jgi:hypothetical protein